MAVNHAVHDTDLLVVGDAGEGAAARGDIARAERDGDTAAHETDARPTTDKVASGDAERIRRAGDLHRKARVRIDKRVEQVTEVRDATLACDIDAAKIVGDDGVIDVNRGICGPGEVDAVAVVEAVDPAILDDRLPVPTMLTPLREVEPVPSPSKSRPSSVTTSLAPGRLTTMPLVPATRTPAST